MKTEEDNKNWIHNNDYTVYCSNRQPTIAMYLSKLCTNIEKRRDGKWKKRQWKGGIGNIRDPFFHLYAV